MKYLYSLWGFPKQHTYLFCNHYQRVAVFREEIKNAPYLKCIIVRDEEVISVEVFPSTQGPAHPVEIYTVKVVLDLQSKQHV